ncbi:MAG TPA: isoprenylcysteine carboxylmethyltransferase family protein [Gemmatimonadaceae bacterium]|nr:isoprenylcysteine carboxylmethyltransferase family protein [Gemmatimonadaceae bacterium]
MVLFLKNFLFTVLVPGTVAGFLPYSILSRGGHLPPVVVPQLLLATPLFAAGVAIYLWCLWDFAVTGRGTPAPIDPPKHLVVRGLYRYVRNPMYVGVWLVVAAWTVAFRSAAMLRYAVAIAVMFHLVVLLVEEPLLRRRFGPAYEDYCRAVRRWLPRWR